MMSKYALIKQNATDPSIGDVVNVVVWDGDANRWQPPTDVDLVLVDEGWGFGVGDIYEYATGEFYRIIQEASEVIEE